VTGWPYIVAGPDDRLLMVLEAADPTAPTADEIARGIDLSHLVAPTLAAFEVTLLGVRYCSRAEDGGAGVHPVA